MGDGPPGVQGKLRWDRGWVGRMHDSSLGQIFHQSYSLQTDFCGQIQCPGMLRRGTHSVMPGSYCQALYV